MTQAAVSDFFPSDFPVYVDPIEVENGLQIPTVYLIDQLQERYRLSHLVHFVMGSDLIKSLHQWDEGQRVIDQMPTVVFNRRGEGIGDSELKKHANFPKNEPVFVG